MHIKLEGQRINSEADFHKELAKILDVEEFYGSNCDALWDFLTGSVERPVTLIWKNAQISKQSMGSSFEKIVDILKEVEQRDQNFVRQDKFKFIID